MTEDDKILYFRLFANCQIVKGVNRSTICDLQNERVYLISNKLFDILKFNEDHRQNLRNILQKYNSDRRSLIKYIDYFIKEGYGFLTSKPDNFPKLKLEWDYPASISNCIFDFDGKSKYLSIKILDEITATGCDVFQLRFYQTFDKKNIEVVVSLLNSHPRVSNIEIVVFHYEKHSELVKKFDKISNILVYNSPDEKSYFDDENIVIIRHISRTISNELSCGNIDTSCFNCNLSNFTESIKYNSCLNRKLSVTKEGKYTNCPSMKHNFGTVKDTSVNQVIRNKQFIKYGRISKDQIMVCKDCEFRYICSDCRAYTVDENNLYSKPLKCNYDPYTSTWN